MSTNARTLAYKLFRDDQGRADEVPVATDGHRAYDGWLQASSDAGDTDTREALEAVDRDAFAAAWEDHVAMHSADGAAIDDESLDMTSVDCSDDTGLPYPHGDTLR